LKKAGHRKVPAFLLPVIPAQAGIQWRRYSVLALRQPALEAPQKSIAPQLDSGLRRNDG
jgi:hypothetical protein